MLGITEVSFPNLGWSFNISRGFSLFGFEIYWYGMIIGLAMALGVFLAVRRAPRHKIKQDTVIDMCLWSIIFAIAGARLYYVLFTPGMLDGGIKEIFNLRNGGLAIYGGVIGGVIAIGVIAIVKKVNIARLLDLAVPYLALGQAIGRWGNFFNQEAFGTSTDSLFAMKSQATVQRITSLIENPVSWIDKADLDPNLGVHPTFLYESVGCLLIFFILIMVRNKRYKRGIVFTLYLTLYGCLRMFIEGLRTDSLMFMNDMFRVSQVLAGACFVIGAVATLLLLFYGKKETELVFPGEEPEGQEAAEQEPIPDETETEG